jgi:CheY-like chemotaxis protein
MTDRKRVERLESDAQQMSEFVAMLAHELRNPLAPIKNAIALAKRPESGPDRMRWALEVVERQATQLNRLVDDLLDVSRITRGTIRLEHRHLSLQDVVQRAVEAVRPRMDEKRQALEINMHAEPVVRGDLLRLTQVMTNLLNNACKYTPPEGRIEVEVHQDGGNAVVSVCDSGVGIAPDLLSRVFDLFTQEDRSLDRAEGGLGLGLAIVTRLVEMHGGSIAAHSAGPGCGSKFTITLPLANEAEDAQHNLTVLVVDDNVDAAVTMQALCEVYEQRALVAYEGEEALRIARATPPDVVLLDIGLPGMSGYEVARRLRNLPGLRDVLLIAVTGYGSEDDRRRSIAAGFDLHLAKPVDFEMLQRRITEWMQ